MSKKSTGFMDGLQKTLNAVNPNVSVTENGAIGYKTSGKALLDLNFALSSMRNMEEKEIWQKFVKALNEDPVLSLIWLFFARDIRGGCGERRSFRLIMKNLADEYQPLVRKLIPLVPEYGTWNDVIWLYDKVKPIALKSYIAKFIEEQFNKDFEGYQNKKPISLLAKWMPSLNTSSRETKRIANNLRLDLHMTPREYRKRLSALRLYLGVVERTISSGKWNEVAYEAVPSKAGLNYRNAFIRHDGERYDKYLTNVKEGKAKMNAGAVFPYEIVHAYMDSDYWSDETLPYDETLELKWKNIPNSVVNGNETLVVVDGSGSMSTKIGNTSISCHDVARSLGIYFSERLDGPFKNSFITFSENPKMVRFNGVMSLKSKLDILIEECDCSNTDIEKTFDMILKTAIDNNLSQAEIPKNILIISDMEFDNCIHRWSGVWPYQKYVGSVDSTLFDEISKRWKAAGYKLPRLVFWNVCSRSETIPVKENELGVALVSGFSPMIADMVMSGELDPMNVLVAKLHDPRYEPVWKVVLPF